MSAIHYRPVPPKFKKNTFDFLMLKREKDVALFMKTKDSYTGYEVVIIQKHDGYEMMGQKVPPSEFYPNSESWGTHGFTFTGDDITGAEAKFAMLLDLKPKETARSQTKKLKLTLKLK